MRLGTRLCVLAGLAALAACAPAQDDPRRKLGYEPPSQHVDRGFSRNEGFRDRPNLRTSSVSNKFGRSRGTIRPRNRRGRIGR